MTRLVVALIASLWFWGVAEAQNPDAPEIVHRFIANAQKRCTEAGGKPGAAEPALFNLDINGDGQKDWLIDYAKFECAGVETPFCVEGYCTFDLLTWRGAGEWRLLLHAAAANWRAGRSSGKPALILTQSGGTCGTPKRKHCTLTYTFANDKMYGSSR